MASSRVCSECGAASPYKCPTCSSPYCSVRCCQTHKTRSCKLPLKVIEDDANENKISILFPTEDTVDVDKLRLLKENEELKSLLKDQLLRDILKNVNAQNNPEKLLKFYMQQEFFTNFVDIVLKTVEPHENSEFQDKL